MSSRLQYNSPVILTFTFLAFTALGLGYLTQGQTTVLLFSVYRGNLSDVFFYIRLFGHVLGHASWEHFMANFLLILALGPMLEEKYGSKQLVVMFGITAFVTGLINILFFKTALLGASGIVFMLILLSSFVNVQKGKIPLTLVLIVIFYIGREFLNAILVKDNVSQLTHMIGGLCGGIFGFNLSRKKERA